MVAVARILRPHALRGELVVEVLSDVPGRLDAGSELWLSEPRSAAGAPRRVRVVGARRLGEQRAVQLEGIADRDAAAALRGAWLEVERERVPAGARGELLPPRAPGLPLPRPAAG